MAGIGTGFYAAVRPTADEARASREASMEASAASLARGMSAAHSTLAGYVMPGESLYWEAAPAVVMSAATGPGGTWLGLDLGGGSSCSVLVSGLAPVWFTGAPRRLWDPRTVRRLMAGAYVFDGDAVLLARAAAPADASEAARRVLGVSAVDFSHLREGMPVYRVAAGAERGVTFDRFAWPL